ncbi:MAG: SpoVG family protein [Lachnospiraceae bacterium]|nr:SpoVG family protein [Lachnospiraceae bacterium]
MYKVEVTPVENREGFKGTGSICFDESLKITGLKILEKKAGGLYVSMPAYKTKEKDEEGRPVYASICAPRNREFAAELTENFLKTYEEALKKGKKAELIVEGAERELNARVTPFEKEGSSILGLGTINIGDDFKINNIRVSRGVSKGKEFEYVDMPSYKTIRDGKEEYQDYAYPVTAEARKKIISTVKNAYKEELDKGVVTAKKGR